jgi:hypothetical protein
VCVYIIELWLDCNCVFWHQGILIIIFAHWTYINSNAKSFFFYIFIPFSKSVSYRNTNQSHRLHKNYFPLCMLQNGWAYQDTISVTLYSTTIQQPLSNSEPQYFVEFGVNVALTFRSVIIRITWGNLWQSVLRHWWCSWGVILSARQ